MIGRSRQQNKKVSESHDGQFLSLQAEATKLSPTSLTITGEHGGESSGSFLEVLTPAGENLFSMQ